MKFLLLLVPFLTACAPTLQVARWQDVRGGYAATIRCTANGQTLSAEVTSTVPLSVREPTPEVPK